MVAHWRFDRGEGDTAPELTGSLPGAKITGARWRRDGDGFALDFDGKRGSVDCGNHPSLSVTDAVTVEAWVHPRSMGQENFGRIVEKGVYGLLMHRDHGVQFYLQDEAGGAHSSYWSSGLPFGRWHHVAGVYDGERQRLYVNGLEGETTAAWTGRIRTRDTRFVVGNVGAGSAFAGPGARAFDGLIDEVAVYRRALSAREIKARYEAGRPLRSIVEPEGKDPAALLHERFADGEAARERWEFEGGAKATLSFVSPCRFSEKCDAYIDFRKTARWQLLCRQPVTLEAGGQYTLSARVCRNLGYGGMLLVAQTCGTPRPAVLAEVSVLKRLREKHEVSVVFAAREAQPVRVGFRASGYSEMWISEIKLKRNTPPIPSYRTGLLLRPRSPTAEARNRTGAFVAAEDAVAPRDAVTEQDLDGDGLWALCRVAADANPWLFSDNTVIKSDSRSAEEGAADTPLRLRVEGLLPGPYQVLLSDPQRDAALSLDGRTWRRIKGGAGEIDLGLVNVTGPYSLRIAHRWRTPDNPGPVYVDYVRFMPVYDPTLGPEQPTAPPPAPTPPPVQETTLRFRSVGAVSRTQEWITAGAPFARGAFRPTDGISIAGAADLATRPLVFWPDGSVKWLRLVFRADVDASAPDAVRRVSFGRAVKPTPTRTSPLQGPPGRRLLKCGQLELVAGPPIWEKLSLAGRELVSRPPAVRLKTASGVVLDQLMVESTDVEDGPRPVLLVRGRLGAGGKAGPASFKARIRQSAPHTLALDFSVVNRSDERYQPDKGCSPAVPLTDLTLVLDGIRIAPAGIVWPVGAAPFKGERQTLLQTGTGACVAETAWSWALTEDGAPLLSGERSAGWVDLRRPGAGLTVGVREFSETQPKSIAVRRSGGGTALEIGVWPPRAGQVMRYAQGTQLTVRIALVLHDGEQTDAERESRLASVLAPVHAAFTPDYYCSSGVFGPVTTTSEERFSGFRASAAKTFDDLRTKRRAHGVQDWGDFFSGCGYVRGDNRLWTNMEWDWPACLVTEFVRTGAPAHLRCADEAARHFADIDIVHYSSREEWIGASYVHTGDTREGHQVDAPNFAHAGWSHGLLWVYYMCGDELLREAAVGLADYVVRNLPPLGPYRSQPPFSMRNNMREAGNPILTLASVYELTRDPSRLRALHRLVDYALRVQDPKLGCWSTPRYESPAYHRVSPNSGGLSYRGLHLYWQLTGDRRVRQAFERLGSFLLDMHPHETRRDLRTGAWNHTSYTYLAEAHALALRFTPDRRSLLDQAAVLLLQRFPAGTAHSFGARGAPGLLSNGARLAGAIDLAHTRNANRKRGAGMREYKIVEVNCGPRVTADDWVSEGGAVDHGNGWLRLTPAAGRASLKWAFYKSGGGDVRRRLVLHFPHGVSESVSVHTVHPTIKWQGDQPRGYAFRFEPDGWILLRGERVLTRGAPLAPGWRDEQVVVETVTLDRQAQCRLNGDTVYEGADDGPQVSNEGAVLIESRGDAVELLAMEEDFIEPAAAPPAWERGEVLLADALSPARASDWVVEGKPPTWGTNALTVRHMSVVWHKAVFESPFVMEFETTPLPAPEKFTAGVTDSIWFWLASDPRHPDDFFADTATRSANPSLHSYLPLRYYWVDFGGNNNTTTRLRYNPLRQLIRQFTDAPRLLKRDRTYRITIVANGPHQEYWCDGKRWARFYDDDPPRAGRIGFRAFVADHRISNLRIQRLRPE